MDNAMLIAGALGIAPALALMYWTMRPYTFPAVERPFFDDRYVFAMLAVGMMVGVIMFTLQSWFPIEIVTFALLFAMIEELLKLVVLNLRRFHGRLDTLFYGLSFGLGIGSTMAFGAVYSGMVVLDDLNVDAWLLFIAFTLQFVFLHGATGATTGSGVVRGYPWEMFGQSVLVHIAYNLLMIPFYTGMVPWGYVTAIAATVMLIAYYVYVDRVLVPGTVDEAVSRIGSKD